MDKKEKSKVKQPWDDDTLVRRDNPDDFGVIPQGDDESLLAKDNPDDFKEEGKR